MFQFEGKYPKNKIAFATDNGDSFTFSDLSNFTETINKIIQHRSLVFCLCQNSAGSLFGYVSFVANSIVPLMLDSGIHSCFLETLINTYRPQYLWLPDIRLNEFKKYQVVLSAHDYSLVKLEEKNSFLLHPDLALLLPTSGSTGSPKLVRISYQNLKANAESICAYLAIDEEERPMLNLPMCYSYGLSVINSHLLKGATLLLTFKSVVEKDYWNFFKNQKATSLAGVPYTFGVLKKFNFSEMVLPSLKTLTVAGGKLNDEVNKYFSEHALNSGRRFFVMYGQTEATARMSYLSPEYAVKKTGSIGMPLPGGEFRLIDEFGNEITRPGIVGELIYKGKNVSMGYSDSWEDLNKGDENHGVLFTGDLAKTDEDSFYYIVGRKSRIIKLFGNRLNLDETENLLTSIVPECACTGNDDNMSIFITDKTKLNEIKIYVSAKTGIHPSAFSVEHVHEIPKNPAGKIDYSMLKNL